MAKKIVLYYNPRCSTCRDALCILEDKGVKPEIVKYLETPPTEKELKDILKKLGIKAEDLLRKKEPLFEKKFKNKKYTEAEWVKIMCKNPILIQRPIAIEGSKAVLGRPAEAIINILSTNATKSRKH